MSRTPVDPFRPDPLDSLPAEFRIDGSLGVRAVLRDLMQREAVISLYPGERHDDFIVTHISHVDETGVEFELGEQQASISALSERSSLIGVAFPGRVKTQFQLSGHSVVAGQTDSRPVLRAPVPDTLWRLQRRDAFRVAPPVEDDARLVRRLAPGEERHYPLTDLSADGLALRLPADEPRPAAGECWPHNRIETADGRIIPCDLMVRHLDADPAGGHRIGLSFHALPGEVQRQIQLYVIDIDKRARRS